MNFSWFQYLGKWAPQPPCLSDSLLSCSYPVTIPQTRLSHSLQGHPLELPSPIPSLSQNQNFRVTGPQPPQPHFSPLSLVPCLQKYLMPPGPPSYWPKPHLFTVHPAHTWFNFHESFIIITPRRWTQYSFLSLFSGTCLGMNWFSLDEIQFSAYFAPLPWRLNQSLLKFKAIVFKRDSQWCLWRDSFTSSFSSHLTFSYFLSTNSLSHPFIEKNKMHTLLTPNLPTYLNFHPCNLANGSCSYYLSPHECSGVSPRLTQGFPSCQCPPFWIIFIFILCYLKKPKPNPKIIV